MMRPVWIIMARDVRLSFERSAEGITTLFFFIVITSLFPFALGGERDVLQKSAAGILWIAALLASLLSLEVIYHRDEEDGTFDLLVVSPVSAVNIVLAKMLAHWVISGLPLILAGIIVSQMLFIPFSALKVLFPSLVMGTLYMSLLGGMGAMLTFGARRPGLLLALLILPLYLPMLILGMAGMEATMAKPYLLLQLALIVGALPLTVGAAAMFLMNARS